MAKRPHDLHAEVDDLPIRIVERIQVQAGLRSTMVVIYSHIFAVFVVLLMLPLGAIEGAEAALIITALTPLPTTALIYQHRPIKRKK